MDTSSRWLPPSPASTDPAAVWQLSFQQSSLLRDGDLAPVSLVAIFRHWSRCVSELHPIL